MKVIVEIPDPLAAIIPDVSRLPRLILEAYCADKFRRHLLTHGDVGAMLGLDQDGTDKFLKANGAPREGGSSENKSPNSPQEKTT